jgi:hypothetical protein
MNYQLEEELDMKKDHQIEQKDGVELNGWFFVQLVLGLILIVKAADGFMPMFDSVDYSPRAQALFSSIDSVSQIRAFIVLMHFVVGSMLLFNIFTAVGVSLSLPVMLNATVFEWLYGEGISQQIVTSIGFGASLLMIYHYKDFFRVIFDYQLEKEMKTEERITPRSPLLQELKKKNPGEYKTLTRIEWIRRTYLKGD